MSARSFVQRNISDTQRMEVARPIGAEFDRINFIVARKSPLSMLGEVITNRDIIDGIESFTIDETEPLTAYMQEAIDDCLPRRRRLYLPVGLYPTGPLTIDLVSGKGAVEIVGESWDGEVGGARTGGVNIRALSGATASLFTLGVNAGPCLFENLMIEGQRDTVDLTVAQYCFDLTPYGGAGNARSGDWKKVCIQDFLKGGMRIGAFRNAGVLDHVRMLGFGGRIVGTAQATTSTTIRLANTASAVDDFYNGKALVVTGSSGNPRAISQKRIITDYDGATRTATLDFPWDTDPSGSVQYRVNMVDADAWLVGSCNDWRAFRCDFGNASRHGVFSTGGASIDIIASNSFYNDGSALRVDPSAADLRWTKGTFDGNKEHGAVFTGSHNTTGVIHSRVIDGVSFRSNGQGRHNTYSDIYNAGDLGLQVLNAQPVPGTTSSTGGRRPRYFLFNPGATKTIVSGLRYDKPRGTVFTTGTAQGGAPTTITLASGASSANARYNEAVVTITAGTGTGQSKVITDYVGSTRVATIDGTWSAAPDATSVYEISAQPSYADALTDSPASLREFQDDGVGTMTITCTTPGDLTVNYTVQNMRWTRHHNRIELDFDLAFTPLYTTATGALIISGLPVSANAASRSSGSLSYKQNVALPTNYDWAVPVAAPGNSYLNLRASGMAGGVASTLLNITAMPNNVAVILRGSISYEI